MKLSKKTIFLLILICLLGFVLRFYKLGGVPSSLEWDEVAIGYDAYSVLKTGRDQFGKLLPLTFRSLDDYKPPLYEYLTIPAIFLFDLNEFSIRFPSAFFGSLSVLMVFFLAKELFKKVKNGNTEYNIYLPLITSFLLAISPWHLQFSRAAFEVNLSVFLVISAVYFFLVALDKPKFLLLSVIFFGLTLFSYHSTRVLTPILLMTLIICNYRRIDLRNKIVQVSGLIYIIFFILFVPILFSKDAQIRFYVTNISNVFLDSSMVQSLDSAKVIDNAASATDLIYRFFHGKKPILTRLVVNNYLAHYNPDFLFVKGDVPLHHAPDFGLLFISELPFILIGIYLYLRLYLSRTSLVLLVWFLAAPIPAAITMQVPHAVRTELFLPTFQIFAAIGMYNFFNLLSKYKYLLNITVLLYLVFFYMDFTKYLHQYYVHTPYELSKQWLYGRKEAALFADSIKNNYDKVIVSVKLEHPHIFFLTYLKYDPKEYLKQGGTYSGGWAVDNNKFDKYEFKFLDNYDELIKKYPRCLIIGLPNEFPKEVTSLKTIYYLNGQPAIKIVAI